MYSSDTILTFIANTVNYTKNIKWVEEVFRVKAEVKYREFTVIVKGILAIRLRAIYNLKDLLYIL